MKKTEIAVIGMSCRFNTADSVYMMHRTLLGGKGCKCGDSGERAALTGYSGEAGLDKRVAYIRNIDKFDNNYFGITENEAVCLSPEIRIALELAAEALLDAGYTYDAMKEKCCGVIASISGKGYKEILGENNMLSEYGSSPSMAAGYIAHYIGAEGPAMMTDSDACTSSLGVVTASELLSGGMADMMLVGGAELALFSDDKGSEAFISSLSEDNECIPYSKKASGTVTGEGGGFVVLKRLDDALRDGDVIYGKIIGYSAGNSGLHSSSVYIPDKETMIDVMKKAWENCGGVLPDEFEGGAIGIPSSDKAEAEAFSEFTGRKAVCGSVRHSVGHTGHLCGLASLIKVMLSFRNNVTYPLGAYAAKGMIKSDKLIFLETPLFHNEDKQRYTGINSFGMNGSCVHIAAANHIEVRHQNDIADKDNQLVVISADTDEQLTELTDRLEEYLVRSKGDINDIIYTLNSKRSLRPVRYASFCKDRRELMDMLASCRKTRKADMNEVILLLREDSAENNAAAEKFLESGLFVKYTGKHIGGELKLKSVSDNSSAEYKDIRSPFIISTYDNPLADMVLTEESYDECVVCCALNSSQIDWTEYYREKKYRNYPMPSAAFANSVFWSKIVKKQQIRQVTRAAADTSYVNTETVYSVTENEQQLMDSLCGILKKHLELDSNIEYDDNFFELGGNSLTGGMALAEFRDTYGIDISFTDMYENPTVRSLIDFYLKRK